MKAIWHDQVLAESDKTVIIEGNHYFPPESIREEFFKESNTHTQCVWKGMASYFDLHVGEFVNRDAAWTYPEPTDAAKPIEGFVAFWKGVLITG